MSDIDVRRLSMLDASERMTMSYRAWAWVPWFEALRERAELEAEVRRLRSEPEPEPWSEDGKPDGEVAYRLRWERWALLYGRARERDRLAAGALGVAWPPPSDRVERGRRPWCWCWEEQATITFARVGSGYERWRYVDGAEQVPVVYPANWDARSEPDVYGLGDRWTRGRMLVVPVDDLPLRPEVVRDRPVVVPVVAEVVAGPGRRGLPAPVDDAGAGREPGRSLDRYLRPEDPWARAFDAWRGGR